MRTNELLKTESFLNGRSRTAKLSSGVIIQHVARVEWATGGYALNIRYGVKTKNGEYQNSALIASFDEAVLKLGEQS